MSRRNESPKVRSKAGERTARKVLWFSLIGPFCSISSFYLQ